MPTAAVPHPTVDERRAKGKEARTRAPLSSHEGWEPASDRPDPVSLLEEQNITREPDLVPVRHGRMMVSPFTFYRGAAKIMAVDLRESPRAGLEVQLCGDAHLSNFGVYASPERNLLFDLNDFDETLPGPWEYDIKRLATSFVVAGRSHGIARTHCREAATASANSYRRHLREYSQIGLLDVWYSRVDAEAALRVFRRGNGEGGPLDLEKAKRRNRLQALSKLVKIDNGQMRIVDTPPLVHHVADDGLSQTLQRLIGGYCQSLQED